MIASSPASRTTATAKVSSEPYQTSPSSSRVERIEKLLAGDSVDLELLRSLSWSGLTSKVRSKAWKILCGYLPGTLNRQEEAIVRKQEEYNQYVGQYFETKDQDVYLDTYRQVRIYRSGCRG